MEFKVNNFIDPAMFSFWIITMAGISKFWPKIMRPNFILNTYMTYDWIQQVNMETDIFKKIILILGAFDGTGAKTVIPRKVIGKFSIR